MKGPLRHLEVFSCPSKELSLSTATLLVAKRSGKKIWKRQIKNFAKAKKLWKDKNKNFGKAKTNTNTKTTTPLVTKRSGKTKTKTLKREKTKTTKNTKTKYSPVQARTSPSPLQLSWWQKHWKNKRLWKDKNKNF